MPDRQDCTQYTRQKKYSPYVNRELLLYNLTDDFSVYTQFQLGLQYI